MTGNGITVSGAIEQDYGGKDTAARESEKSEVKSLKCEATRYAIGVPLTVTAATNSANSFGGGSLRPDLAGDPEGPQTVNQWFNAAAFAQPAANQFGSSPNGVLRGPGTHLTDLGVFKNFRIGDQLRLQYRLEMFNAFNQTQFSGVGTTLGTPTFGTVTSAGEPRMIEMALKLTF